MWPCLGKPRPLSHPCLAHAPAPLSGNWGPWPNWASLPPQEFFVRSWICPGLCVSWKNRNTHLVTPHNFPSEISETLWLSHSVTGMSQASPPHAFPPCWSAFCLSVPVGRHLLREASPDLPPMALASLSSAPLWFKLGHPHLWGAVASAPP